MSSVYLVKTRTGTKIFLLKDSLRYAFLTAALMSFVLCALVVAAPIEMAIFGVQASPADSIKVQDVLASPTSSPESPKLLTPSSQWPIKGAISTYFGGRNVYTSFHNGIDIEANFADLVKPFRSGIVTHSGWGAIGYGNYVQIDHGGGMSSIYAHLSKSFVTQGQSVDLSTPLGLIGQTGWATGPHLHFQINLDGRAVDPLPYLK